MKYSGELVNGKTVIVKYDNRKLYNTSLRKYVTLSQILSLGVDSFMVVDHASGSDITNDVLINALSSHFRKHPLVFEVVKPILADKLSVSESMTVVNN